MTEDEAKLWARERYSQQVVDRLSSFADMLAAENECQNLVAPSTVGILWSRHIVDSLQLIPLARQEGVWLDIGTGGGFPGMVIAVAGERPMILVEPRRKRAEFLQACVDALELAHIEVITSTVENVSRKAAIISARAVASVENILRVSAHCATPSTQWILPRGVVTPGEVERLQSNTGMMFHVEQSLTDLRSSIVLVTAR